MLNNNYSLMDMLTILSIILQLQVMEEQKYQSNNDDIMEELQRQDKAYLEKIIKNQEMILAKLNMLAV